MPRKKRFERARIFVSHAHADAELANAFASLLQLGLALPREDIFCTSTASRGVIVGKSFNQKIQKTLSNCDIAIALITNSFCNSTYCSCELGAIWGCAKPFIPVLAPPVTREDMQAIISSLNPVRLDNSPSMHLLVDRLTTELRLPPVSIAKWDQELKVFERQLPRYFRGSGEKRVRGDTFLNIYALAISNSVQRLCNHLANGNNYALHLVLLDVDRQKQINESHGTDVGDKVLDEIANVFLNHANRVIEQGRCGDDTFFAIVPGSNTEALSFANELQTQISQISKAVGREDFWVTASIGISRYVIGCSMSAWKSTAYRALLKARQRGGDCVEVGPPAPLHEIIEKTWS